MKSNSDALKKSVVEQTDQNAPKWDSLFRKKQAWVVVVCVWLLLIRAVRMLRVEY